MKHLKSLFLMLVLFMISCQGSQEQNLNTVPSVQANLPTLTPSSTRLNTPTTLSTSTMIPTLTDTPAPTPSPTEITPTPESQETITASIVEMGRLYFTRPSWYGWFDLIGQENGQEFIIDSSNDFHQFSSHELIDGPGNHKQFEFSHFSDLMAYASFTAYPGEFWLSDVDYREPRKIFTDSNGRWDSEDPDYLDPWTDLKIVWSPDDKHIFLYHVTHPELSLVYHLESDEFEEWYWNCDSIVLSEKSDQLATLCPRVSTAAQDQKAYAVLEWGGEIWYSDTFPGQMFLQATDDGMAFWQWSADGEHLAYYDPNDLEGHLLIADSHGNVQKFLPGISVFRKFEAVDLEYAAVVSSLDDPHFVWAKNAPILLVKGYAQPESPCPPLVTEYDPDLYVEQWPCWQAINIENGEVSWSEAVLGESLSLNEAGEAPFYMGIADLTVSPDGRFIAFHSFEPNRRTIVVDLRMAQATTILEFDAVDKLYWANNTEN